MNERLKAARKALHLTQRELGQRLGVKDTAISKLESGENSLTDQMILAMRREFLINEEWLRTGAGEMFVENDGTIIAALVDEFGLDGLDQKILETYLAMPEDHRTAVKGFLVRLARAIESGETESAEEYIAAHPLLFPHFKPRTAANPANGNDIFKGEWGKGLTREEYHNLIDERFDAAKKGDALSMTSGKHGENSTLRKIKDA